MSKSSQNLVPQKKLTTRKFLVLDFTADKNTWLIKKPRSKLGSNMDFVGVVILPKWWIPNGLTIRAI